MSSGSALHSKSSTDSEYEKYHNVPLRKNSCSECQLDIDYHPNQESLQLLLLSSPTSEPYRIHLTTINSSKSDLKIKSKKSNKMVIDNKTNDSYFNESTNLLTTKPKNKHKDKNHKEIRQCDAVIQSSFSKMDRAEGNPKVKDESEKHSHRKTHKHKKHHSEYTDMEKELKKDKKIQIVTNEDEDLTSYKRKKKSGVDKATDPLGYTKLINNSQLCFVLSTDGSSPFKNDSHKEPIIKVKGALVNGKERRSKSKREDIEGLDLKTQGSNETIEKRPKSDGISFFFKKKKLFSRSPSVKDEDDSANKIQESDDKASRRKSRKREELKSPTVTKEKHKHHSKNRSQSANATPNMYMDRESVESKSYVGDAFKILKRSKKRNVSLKGEDAKREKVKSRSEKVKKHSHETEAIDKNAKHNKKSDNEGDSAWYKLKRKNKTRSNSLSGFEEKKEDRSKETKVSEKDGKSQRHHKSKKKRDKSATNSLCVVTSDTLVYTSLNEREKMFEVLKTKKKGDDKIGSPNVSYHKIKKRTKDRKETEKTTKRQTDTSEKKQRRHHEYKQNVELEDIISRGAKEIHDELKQSHHREHHHERRRKSPTKSKHRSKSRGRCIMKDITSKSENEISRKGASDSNILHNKSSTKEYVISNSDYAVILEKIVSGKHSFKELTSAIEENHFFEALKSGALLTPKHSANLKNDKKIEEKKSYAVTKKQLEVLINYLKSSVDVNKTNSLDITVSDEKLTEVKLERQEISFSNLNLNPINEFYDRNCWDRFVPKNKRQKRRTPFDQHSIVSDAITAKEKSQYLSGSRYFQNRNARNFSYSENVTERSNRSFRKDQKSGLGFTVEGVEPPKKLRPDVSSVNLTKLIKDGQELPKTLSPNKSSSHSTKSNMKKPLHISVLSVLEIKPNFAEVFNKSNMKFEYDIASQPIEEMMDLKEEPARGSKSILKKASNTSEYVTGFAVSNVSLSRKQSNASGCKLNVIASAISQNKSRLSISDSEKSVDLKSVVCNKFQNQNSRTKFPVRASNSLETRNKFLPSLDDNRKALKKYSLLSEKCSLSEPRGIEGLNHDLDKDQLANLGQEVLEMMKKYINLSKSEECPNMDLSSFGADFLTNVRTCIHERLKPVKEELDMETKESALPRTDSKSLTKRPSSTTKRIREDINKCVQNYLDSNSVASLNQDDLTKITSNVTKKVESYLNDSKKEKSLNNSKNLSKTSVSSKEGVRARMANYINTINEKRRGSSVTASRSREGSVEGNCIKRTLSNLSRSSVGSVNLKRGANRKVSEKSLNEFSNARGSTSSGLSAISRDESASFSNSKKIEDGHEILPNVHLDAAMLEEKKEDLVQENIDVPDLKCSISSVLLPKIAEESPSQSSFGLNGSQKIGKKSNPVVKCLVKVAPKQPPPKSRDDTRTTGISDSLKSSPENKVRKRVSKNEINEKLKIIAQDMSERVMKALKCSSDEGSVTVTGDDISSVASQFSEIITNNVSNKIDKIKESDSKKHPITKTAKLKPQGVAEKYSSNASLHQKLESTTLLKNSKVVKPIIKKKKKVNDKVSNFSHKGSESQFVVKETDLTPLKSIDTIKKPKQENLEASNLQSTENVAMLNELISKNIMNILGKNSQLAGNTTKEKVVKKKKEENPPAVGKPTKQDNEEGERKKKIIDKLAAAILDDKIFGNLESQLSKLLDKQSDEVESDSGKKVVVKEQVREKAPEVVKKEIKRNVAPKVIKTVVEESNLEEVSETSDSKKLLIEKVSKIPRFTRFGAKSTTSHFGAASSDAGSNIGSNIGRPTTLPRPLKKTTNALRTPNPSTNYVQRLPVPSKLSVTKEDTDAARPLSTFEKRKLYSANMRAKKLASKSEAEFAAEECAYGKPYDVLYVTGEGPSVDPRGPLSKYIFDESSNSKKTKKCEKKSSCTKAPPSTEVTIEYNPSNDNLNISSNQLKIEQDSAVEIRSENNFLRDCDNDSNIFRNNCARRASSVSLYSQESRFSQEICMHCLTPKAALSLVSITTNNQEKVYSTRSNSILHIDGSDSSREMVKKPRSYKKHGRQVFNMTHFLGNNKEVLSAFLQNTEGPSKISIKSSPNKRLKSKADDSIKRVKSWQGFIEVGKKNYSIEGNHFHQKRRNVPKSYSTFEEPHSSNYHTIPGIKIKKKIYKFRKQNFVAVTESSICDSFQEKPKKPKKKHNKRCPSELSSQSPKCEYFKLHKPLVNLTKVIRRHNKALCAKVNKFRNVVVKSKRSLCNCEYKGSEEMDGCYTVFKNFQCPKIETPYLSDEGFQFFRFGSLTDLDTNYSKITVQNTLDSELLKQKYLHRVPSKTDSINVESGYETNSIKTVNSSRRSYSMEKNILSQFTSDFRYFDAGYAFPTVYNVYPVNTNGNQSNCCNGNSDSCKEINRKPLSPCAQFRLRQARSADKGTSPKPNKVTFKKCVIDSETEFCENEGTGNCECKKCTRKSSKNENNEKPRLMVCRNPKCPKNIKAQMENSGGRISDDGFSVFRCRDSITSESGSSTRSSNSRYVSIGGHGSSSSTYSCGYSEPGEVNIKQSGSIRSGCIPKYIWCKVKNKESAPPRSSCSCGTNYQAFQKEKEQCKEYAQKVRKESNNVRKGDCLKQFSDFKEIPLCVLLNSNGCKRDSCPKYDRSKDESPKLKVLDNDYNEELSCMRSVCPRNTSASAESSTLLEESRDSTQPELPKNLNNLSKESLIDIINEQFQSSLKSLLDTTKERPSVSSKEVSAQLIKAESSAILEDTSVQAMALDNNSEDLITISSENQDPLGNSVENLAREELDYTINKMPSTSSRSQHAGSKCTVRSKTRSKQLDTCKNSTCENRKTVKSVPPPPATVASSPVDVPEVGPRKCSVKKTPSGKKDVNCHCLDFQNMPKTALLKLKEQIDRCLIEENDQMKPRMSKKSSFPFNATPVDNQISAHFMQTPIESSNLSRPLFAGLSPNAPSCGKSINANSTPFQLPKFSVDSSNTLFLESYWGSTDNNMGLPEEVTKPLLLPRNIASGSLKSSGTRENCPSTEDIPSKEQSFKTPSKQQILNSPYPEDARCDSNYSIPNMLNKTLKELEFINATKQSLEASSEKLSQQLKTLSIELLLQSTNQEDSNNSQYENVTSMKEAIDTTFRHLLNSSKEALAVSSKEAQNQLMQSITELSSKSVSDNSLREHPSDVPKRSHKTLKIKSKESSEPSLASKTSSTSGAVKKVKSGPKEGRRRTLKEPPTQSSTEVLVETNDKKVISTETSATSTSSKYSQESQEITTVDEDVESINGDSLTNVEEDCQTSNETVKITIESSTDPMDSPTRTISTKGIDTRSNELVKLVDFNVMNVGGIANPNLCSSSDQLSAEILTSHSEDTAQNFKDSLSSLMNLIEMKSDELLNLSQESLVVSLDEIIMLNESNLSSEDLSKKLGVLFKTSLVKLLDMKPDSFDESILQETLRNTVEELLNEIFDEASNLVYGCNVVAKTQKHLSSDLYQDLLGDLMEDSDRYPFEKPIDTISKVAIVMMVHKISCVRGTRRSTPIPEELLMEMAKVSLQAIIELYKKMYSKKEVDVSFKVMVEDMCRDKYLNKKKTRGLTGSQLEIINILNKKYVSESNTKNYKNCLCSPIKDKPPSTSDERRREKDEIVGSSKFTVKSKELEQQSDVQALEKLREKEVLEKSPIKDKPSSASGERRKEKAKITDSSKFTVKSKELDQQTDVQVLEKLREKEVFEKSPIKDKPSSASGERRREKAEIVGSSKFTVKGKESEQKTDVQEMEKLQEKEVFEKSPIKDKPSSASGERRREKAEIVDSSKFTVKGKESEQKTDVQALEKLREKEVLEKSSIKDKPSSASGERRREKAEIVSSSKKGKESEQQSDVQALEKLRETEVLKKYPIKDKPSSASGERKREKAEIVSSSKKGKESEQQSDVQALEKLREKEVFEKSPIKDKPSSASGERKREKAEIGGSSKFTVKGKESEQKTDVQALGKLRDKEAFEKSSIKDKPSSKSGERKKEKAKITGSSKFTMKSKEPEQQTDVQALEKLREQLTDKEVFEKLLDTYENEEKIVERLSKDDVFFQSQLELVKSKESIESMFNSVLKQSSSVNLLLKSESGSLSEKFSSSLLDSTSSAPVSSLTTTEDISQYFSEKTDSDVGKKIEATPKQSKKISQDSGTTNEKLLYKYDYDDKVSTYADSQKSKPSSPISEVESTKSGKLGPKSKPSGIKSESNVDKKIEATPPQSKKIASASEATNEKLPYKYDYDEKLSTYEDSQKLKPSTPVSKYESTKSGKPGPKSKPSDIKSKSDVDKKVKVTPPQSKKIAPSSEATNEKMLYKYDFDEMVSTYEDSQKSKPSSQISEVESTKSGKPSPKSKPSGIKSKGNVDKKIEATPPQSKMSRLRSSFQKLSKSNLFGKNASPNSEASSEKLLYKYDLDKMVSTQGSQKSKQPIPKSKDESTKPSKPDSKSKPSDFKSKVGHLLNHEPELKEIVAPRPERDRKSINESYLANTPNEISEDDQKVKLGGKSKAPNRKDPQMDLEDFLEISEFSHITPGTHGSSKINPVELGKCFLRGFRPDNITLNGDACLKISDRENEERRLKPHLYRSPSINFSERETPLDFLLALGFSIDEASNAIKDEDVKNRLLAAITEARIWINKITAVQGTLLYLNAYKTKPKIMRYFLQLVEAIINKRITDAVQLDGFLRVLEKVEDGDVTLIEVLGSEKFSDDDNDEKLVKKQLREIFFTVYQIAETESESRNKPLSKNAITLLRILAAKYRAGLHPHLELIAKYIGQGLLHSEVQLEAAMIYLARLDTAYVNLQEFEEYTAIRCPKKKK